MPVYKERQLGKYKDFKQGQNPIKRQLDNAHGGKLHGGDSFEVFGFLQLPFYFEESLCYRSA